MSGARETRWRCGESECDEARQAARNCDGTGDAYLPIKEAHLIYRQCPFAEMSELTTELISLYGSCRNMGVPPSAGAHADQYALHIAAFGVIESAAATIRGYEQDAAEARQRKIEAKARGGTAR